MSGYMAELDMHKTKNCSTLTGPSNLPKKDSINIHANASLLADFFNIHKTGAGSTLTGPSNMPKRALPEKDRNTIHANASLLADYSNVHKTPDAVLQVRKNLLQDLLQCSGSL